MHWNTPSTREAATQVHHTALMAQDFAVTFIDIEEVLDLIINVADTCFGGRGDLRAELGNACDEAARDMNVGVRPQHLCRTLESAVCDVLSQTPVHVKPTHGRLLMLRDLLRAMVSRCDYAGEEF